MSTNNNSTMMNIVIKKLILLIEINLFTPELNIIYKFILFYGVMELLASVRIY